MQKTRLPICQLVLQAMAGDNLNFYTGSGSMVLYIAKALWFVQNDFSWVILISSNQVELGAFEVTLVHNYF